MIMKKKIVISFFMSVALYFALSISTAFATHNTCKGYEWRTCPSGQKVIRCTCVGGDTCWAAWQELCD